MDRDKAVVIENVARVGYIAKGLVYLLIGILTFLYSVRAGGDLAGKSDIFTWVLARPFGRILLMLIGAGLACYAAWRWLYAFRNHEKKTINKFRKGIAIGSSALTYTSVSLSAFLLAAGKSDSGHQGNQKLAEWLITKPFGIFLIYLAAAILTGKAVYQLYQVVSGKYKKHLTGLKQNVRSWLFPSCAFGIVARGIVLGILGYFLFNAGRSGNPKQAKGTEAAFRFIDVNYGEIILSGMALGIALYGIYMLLRARYERIPV
jgi:hypothetical protein